MKLEDWLDDLCVRFIVNLPREELESVERICFQVEEAQWFYEDFIRPLDPSLPSLSLRAFSLRIFQHCQLFSQWSAQYHTTAFAEFLAYKQRVPVRGAIMLNEEMDRVVLVKGWKKGANWSFPRGKINKDEDDLDCAVREVYEETGFDIEAAGLVEDAKETKFIEITMREQHMRLYVFRGVPIDTHFEPRTRKEISKIEWYKLTDLPTIKKHKHQDSNGEPLVVNSNKFYMVAPFLNPLKKWISQQRRSENRQTSRPAADLLTEQRVQDVSTYSLMTSHGPSDLPEVTNTEQQLEKSDPSLHLKRLLKINSPPLQEVSISPPSAILRNDAAKSSALLALLRSGSTAEMHDMPNTPRAQSIYPPDVPTSLHQHHPRPPAFSPMPAPPQFQVPSEIHIFNASLPQNVSYAYRQRQEDQHYPLARPLPPPGFQNIDHPPRHEPEHPIQQLVAPYQRTGDLLFSQKNGGPTQVSTIPPASALPKLTNHTRTLLDVFKTGLPHPKPAPQAHAPPTPEAGTTGFALESQGTMQGAGLQPKPSMVDKRLIPPAVLPPKPVKVVQVVARASKQLPTTSTTGTAIRHPKVEHRANLLDLFRQSSSASPEMVPIGRPVSESLRPAELAADSKETQAPFTHDTILKILHEGGGHSKLNPGKQELVYKYVGTREGETAATVSGPLNQPQFDGIMKTPRKPIDGHGRSPVAPNRTLYDPNQPTPIKILARPDDHRSSPARSPRLPKSSTNAASPKRVPASQEHKETPKLFQPQILRRPQAAAKQDHPSPFPASQPLQQGKEQVEPRLAENVSQLGLEELLPTPTQKRPLQVESHRQVLLSLFNKPIQNSSTPVMAPEPVSAISPFASQPISPLTLSEAQMQSMDPISTRSRMGSLASSIGGLPRPSMEKRQTTAGDKAFLLGYLGRIASQEG